MLLQAYSQRRPERCFSTTPDNLLLQNLSPKDRGHLRSHVEHVAVTRGTELFAPADACDHVYFSHGPMISLEQSDRVEVAIVGREGMVGWPALIGGNTSLYRGVVRGRDGTVTKIPTSLLKAAIAASPQLHLMLQQFMSVVNVQLGETIGASTSHRMEMRVARWLLLRHDRVGGDEILANHDEVAENLGVRRASITDCLHILEGEHLVRCKRRRIWIRDRAGLEAIASNHYGNAETHYRELIGKFGKSATESHSLVTPC